MNVTGVPVPEKMNTVKVAPFSGLRSLLPVVLLPLVCFSFGPLSSASALHSFQPARTAHKLSHEDELFLEDLEHRSFRYFWDQADSGTGLVPDRARMDGSPLDENHQHVASIAATGFGLTTLCI